MELKRITSPLKPDVIESLSAGDMVRLSGRIVTARDQVHKYLASGGEPPIDLSGMVIYHCGPLVIKEDGRWKVKAAGPTTSMREEPYEEDIISRFRPGAIMGKGGMGDKTLNAMSAYGCIYLNVTGGAAQYLARCIVEVETAYLEEFGQVEAMWVLKVKDMPALVSMDSKGCSLHGSILSRSSAQLDMLLEHRIKNKSRT
ncbi:MAG TPA: FumA C-terminus/TtdB family hydratase beta subunit [Desulfomonilia bacterium]|nr:FumA C-terminus/TtdB family hydratase beta subunit [Desulfomonilia bacterium]